MFVSKFIVVCQDRTSTYTIIIDTCVHVDVVGEYNVLASPPSAIPFKQS
jgi:hypothetical protein